ncbi:GlxA family transcriptional regulator [Spirosoma endbachense]|uniref:Helix-turn-helix domain-containing protein n=1 Tax=Spirosoma endbachense TaxID=2666025 RepID=A0A6P1W794_9BACT|nr:helix-turn-helix domain-containing protein [Spirosoma endbachense]QHW00243.1 helix-turn-helix domain-containing protein [Spirosoma endbachense]
MKHISILPLYEATLASIDTTHQLFSRINDFMHYQGKPPVYQIEVVGLTKHTKLASGRYSIQTDRLIDELDKTDVIVLPLLCSEFKRAIHLNLPYTDWLIGQYRQGAEILCLCVGSFYLASTGLLDGRKCAVHWAAVNEFKQLFPAVNVVDNVLITDERGIYTCGGGFSYLNLLLYLFEKQLGRDIAILAAKMFEIDLDRKSQNAYAIFIGQKQHGDELVLKAQELIEEDPGANWTVDRLCQKLCIGRRSFERRFKARTTNTLVEYVQRVKVEFAKKQLEGGQKTINEIVYATGYIDLDAFRKVFRKVTDLSPVEYRKKYGGYR